MTSPSPAPASRPRSAWKIGAVALCLVLAGGWAMWRHRTAAEVWDRHLGRIDRALHHWQQAWQLEPDRTDALAAARALYASLGDDAMVARLYQAADR